MLLRTLILELRPLGSAGITRFPRYYGPLRRRREPGLTLAGCPLRLPPLSSSVSRASCAFLRCMPSSLPRWNCRVRLSRFFLCNAGLPRVSVRSASTTSVSRPHRAFTCVTAYIFAGSPSDPLHRRLRRIRCLLRRFDCYWASDPSQAGLPPARIHTHSRRTDTYSVSQTHDRVR